MSKITNKRIAVLDTEIAYVDQGTGDPVVFLHGNPTSSYLWRNVIPHLADAARCLAPDLVGMGDSGPSTSGYRFEDHARYLGAWFDAVIPDGPVTLVIHDWGSALGFDWASRHVERVKGIAFMEAIVRPLAWTEWPPAGRPIFEALRSPAGEEMILQKNVFVENILPGSIIRPLTDDELAEYRRPFTEPGESRRPTLTWPREIPFDGEPADVAAIATRYAEWLSASPVPKLFVNADPGSILTGEQREFARRFPNLHEVTVSGRHFIQEDSPDEIGQAIRGWYQQL